MNRLVEDSRSQLLSQGKRGASYAPSNQYLGKNRYQRRLHSKVAASVKQYNEMDMDKFFKKDILDVNVQVNGETDNYIVKIKFGDILDYLYDEIEKNNGNLNIRIVTRALIKAFNGDNTYIYCSCPDFKFRFAHYALVKDISSVDPSFWNSKGASLVVSQSAKITNPRDDKGPGCKHILLVLSNNTWLMKVASVIFNYVNYMEKRYQKLYADVIYPAIYKKDYEGDVQLDITSDEDELITDTDTLDTSNKYAHTKNAFQKGNEYRFQKDTNRVDQKQFNFDDLISDESEV